MSSGFVFQYTLSRPDSLLDIEYDAYELVDKIAVSDYVAEEHDFKHMQEYLGDIYYDIMYDAEGRPYLYLPPKSVEALRDRLKSEWCDALRGSGKLLESIIRKVSSDEYPKDIDQEHINITDAFSSECGNHFIEQGMHARTYQEFLRDVLFRFDLEGDSLYFVDAFRYHY